MDSQLIELFDKGKLVFGSVEEFNIWLNEPSFGLAGQIPANLLDTHSGIELIIQELIRIEYGDIA